MPAAQVTGLVCAALIFYNHNEIRLVKWLIIVVLGLLYNSVFLARVVRQVPLLKIFYVGLVWALVNSWLSYPGFDGNTFSISFLFVTALVLPFDIRDMRQDEIVTFPRLIGVKRTKLLACVLVIISAVLAFWHLASIYAAAFGLTSAVTLILIYFSENSRPDSYFSVWVELCAALPLLFLLLLKMLGY